MFTEYSDKFYIESDGEYIVYAKLTDGDGNTCYINSNGIVFDSVKPQITGVENGKVYCSEKTVTVIDKYAVTVTVNGEPRTLTDGKLTLSPYESTQTVIATDMAGNANTIAVTVNDGHRGGTASCTLAAKCEICGADYGEKNSDNHSLERVAEKAATENTKGNTEYWCCKTCGRCFSDMDGKTEIKLSDTVLPKKTAAPKTGDNSHAAIWFAVFALSGGVLTCTALGGKKRKTEKR